MNPPPMPPTAPSAQELEYVLRPASSPFATYWLTLLGAYFMAGFFILTFTMRIYFESMNEEPREPSPFSVASTVIMSVIVMHLFLQWSRMGAIPSAVRLVPGGITVERIMDSEFIPRESIARVEADKTSLFASIIPGVHLKDSSGKVVLMLPPGFTGKDSTLPVFTIGWRESTRRPTRAESSSPSVWMMDRCPTAGSAGSGFGWWWR